MLGSITLYPDETWTQPADIHGWIDDLVEDYRQGAIIEQHVDRWTLAAILRRRWAGQITFGTLTIVPNKTPAESVDEWSEQEVVHA
jgi:hypothetical protein